MSVDSVFELASTSKLFTTATAQVLVDEGSLNWNDKVRDFIPSQIAISSTMRDTTLLHLATHTSGFPSLPDSFILKMTDPQDPYRNLEKSDIYDYLKKCDGKKSEGAYEYSNFGMGLLGHILELQQGEAFEKIVTTKLLDPIGMSSTYISQEQSKKTKIIQGFDENGYEAPVWTDTVLTGAGSFLSNVDDMLKFIRANIEPGSTSVGDVLVKMQSTGVDNDTIGWVRTQTKKHGTLLWHNGLAGAYASFILINPSLNYGFILLSNKAISVTNLSARIHKSILDLF